MRTTPASRVTVGESPETEALRRRITYLDGGHLPYPSSGALLTWNHDPEGPLRLGECLAVTLIGNDDHAVCEGWVQLRKGEDRSIAICCSYQRVQGRFVAAKLLADRSADMHEQL